MPYFSNPRQKKTEYIVGLSNYVNSSLSGALGLQGPNYFYRNTKMLIAFCPFNILTNGANTMVGTLAQIKAVTSNCTWSTGIHHYALKVFQRRKRHFTYNVCDEAVILLNLNPYVFLMLQVMKWAHMSTPTVYMRVHLCAWIVSWTNHFHRTPFSLERMTDKQWLFQLEFLIDIFSKKEWREPVISRKTQGSIYCQ